MKKIHKITALLLTTGALLNPISASALTKSETVYLNLNYDGTKEKLVVNNHLSKLNSSDVEDQTLLKEIVNLNGNEKFDLNNNTLTWKSSGKDIFYQGKTDKESPISTEIKYYMNDKESTPKKMAGKKGKVKIVIKMTNNSYDENKKLYIPYVVTLGLNINNNENTNIQITNGSVVDTGNKSMLVALLSPGLYQNFKIDEFKNLDEVTITYDTTNFALNNMYFIATPKLLDNTDLTIFDKVNTLNSSMNTIQTNMDKINDGAKKLSEGTKSLSNGSDQITTNLNNALIALKKLESGSITITNGLDEVLKSLQSTKEMINNKNITGSITNLQQLKKANETAITNLNNTNNSLKDIYLNNSLANFKSEEELKTYFSSINIDENTISNLITCKKTYEGNLSLITLLQTNNSALDQMIASLTEISQTLDTLINQLQGAIEELTNGSKQLTTGITQLKIGLEKIYAGSNTLTTGTKELESATNTLSTGIDTLNKEGINKLTTASSKLNSYSNKTKELVKMSKEYKGFTSNNSYKTLFIYKVASVK